MGCLRTTFLLLVVGLGLSAVLVAHILREDVVPGDLLSLNERALLKVVKDKAPPKLLRPEGGYHFGRWKEPIRNLTMQHERVGEDLGLLARARELARVKRWEYFSLVDERYFLAVCLVHFNYLEDVFVYLVDRRLPTEKHEFHARRLPALGVDFAPSSQTGCTTFAADLLHRDAKDISLCFNEADRAYRIEVSVALTSPAGERNNLVASFAASAQESLVLSYPLAGSAVRPAYVHKSAGMDTVGKLKFAGDDHFFSGHAALDWTKSLALRETTWNWVSVSGNAEVLIYLDAHNNGQQVKRTARGDFGINLSARVYDLNGASCENGVWLNHTLYPVGAVRFEVPREPLKDSWKIKSANPLDQVTVDLEFVPKGAREDHTNLGLIASNFVQPYGVFSGIVTLPAEDAVKQTIIIRDAFGVVEDHYALW